MLNKECFTLQCFQIFMSLQACADTCTFIYNSWNAAGLSLRFCCFFLYQIIHVVPTSWLNYLRWQIVFCLYVFSLYFCLFFIYSLSFILFVFVPLNLSKLSLIVSLSPFHSLHNSTLQHLFCQFSTIFFEQFLLGQILKIR